LREFLIHTGKKNVAIEKTYGTCRENNWSAGGSSDVLLVYFKTMLWGRKKYRKALKPRG
jgi:hypothetical protein